MRSTERFDLFWKLLTKCKKAQELNIDEPILPRKRRAPKRIEIGESSAEFQRTLTITEYLTLRL